MMEHIYRILLLFLMFSGGSIYAVVTVALDAVVKDPAAKACPGGQEALLVLEYTLCVS